MCIRNAAYRRHGTAASRHKERWMISLGDEQVGDGLGGPTLSLQAGLGDGYFGSFL